MVLTYAHAPKAGSYTSCILQAEAGDQWQDTGLVFTTHHGTALDAAVRTTLHQLGATAAVAEKVAQRYQLMAAIGWSLPTQTELDLIEAAVDDAIPGTAERQEQLAAAIEAIAGDRDQHKLIARLAGGLKRPELRELPPWVLLVLVAWLLFRFASEPLDPNASVGQDLATGNDLTVIAIIVTVASMIRRRD